MIIDVDGIIINSKDYKDNSRIIDMRPEMKAVTCMTQL